METMQLEQNARKQEVYRHAVELYRQKPDWVTFFREVLGVDGVVRRVFQPSEVEWFEQQSEYQLIQRMVSNLRGTADGDGKESMKVITVRLPTSLHDSLKAEAKSRGTSMNKLCISKLLQVIEDEFVPPEPASLSSADSSFLASNISEDESDELPYEDSESEMEDEAVAIR